MAFEPVDGAEVADERFMAMAIEAASTARLVAPPNPWVGAVVVSTDGEVFTAATGAPGERHAEVGALSEAGPKAPGSTLYVTLEPCSHFGRTPPCVEAVIEAGVGRVVVGIADPDPKVNGEGLERLRQAGVAVSLGISGSAVEEQLAPYLKHRRRSLPWVVLKVAASLDGWIAAADGSSKWITGEPARADAHELRQLSDAVLVGAGTVRADDPDLRVRLPDVQRQPLRVVLGSAPGDARMRPCLELNGELEEVLAELAQRDVIQLLVEGGAKVAHEFHSRGLVDRYVVYLAPVVLGGDDATPIFSGPGAPRLSDAMRGRFLGVKGLGEDLRIDFAGFEVSDES